MRTPLHQAAGEGDGVHVTAHRTDGAALQTGAVHDGRVQADLAEYVWQSAEADGGILRVALDDATAGFHRVNCAAAAAQRFDRGGQTDAAVAAGQDDQSPPPQVAGTTASPRVWVRHMKRVLPSSIGWRECISIRLSQTTTWPTCQRCR